MVNVSMALDVMMWQCSNRVLSLFNHAQVYLPLSSQQTKAHIKMPDSI